MVACDLPLELKRPVDGKSFSEAQAEIESCLGGYTKSLVVRIAKTWDSRPRKRGKANVVHYDYGDGLAPNMPDYMKMTDHRA